MNTQLEIMQREEARTTAVTPMDMIDRALASGAAPETLEKLLNLQERWEASQGRKAFDEAIAAAKAEIPVIIKNRHVDFVGKTGIRTNYRHEDLAEVARTVNPILSKHGLSYRFRTSSPPNEPVSVTCIISHRLGYSEENTLSAGKDDSGNKNSIQAIGSTLTYLQRMTLKAALGLAAAEDDDGARSEQKSGPISEDQFKTLQTLIDKTGTDTEKLCRYFRIDAIRDLPADQYADATAMLGRKLEKSNA